MKYLLTEKEYRALAGASEIAERNMESTLQKLCTLAADNVPLPKSNWINSTLKEGEPLRAWGCILSEKHEWYCDDCPVQDVCPHRYKKWSK